MELHHQSENIRSVAVIVAGVLSDLPGALRDAGFKPARYRRFYELCLDGALPAERGKNGRWVVSRDDLPAIAKAMNLPRLDEMEAA